MTGTSSANTVRVASGATLRASGDLGDGNDVLDVAGTLDTGSATLFLGAGDDTFIVHDTTVVMGALDAGAGNDELNVNVSVGSLVLLGSTEGFESLGKSGAGTLQINGPSSFVSVDIEAGLLEVAAGGKRCGNDGGGVCGRDARRRRCIHVHRGCRRIHDRRHGQRRGHDRHARRRRSAHAARWRAHRRTRDIVERRRRYRQSDRRSPWQRDPRWGHGLRNADEGEQRHAAHRRTGAFRFHERRRGRRPAEHRYGRQRQRW